VIIGISLATILFVTFYKPMYHVSAPMVITSPDKVQISSPFEAVIREIGQNANGDPLRPGDTVQKGQVLAVLDTNDLMDRLAQARAEHEAALMEMNRAFGDKTKISESKIAAKKAEGAAAQMALYQRQIDHSTIVAPFAGQILKGDLSSHIGQKASLGEELYELQQTGKLRIEMTVAERDIQDVKQDATGRFATDSLPWDKYSMKVTRILPVPDVKEGANSFMVYGEAVLEPGQEPRWQPGMAGEARIDVTPRRLAWIWTHRLIDFLRLKLWM